jgi:hypothetical protein
MAYIKAVHPFVMAEWAAEVQALPKRKQSGWHTLLKNGDGTFRKVRCDEGFFELKVSAKNMADVGARMVPKGGWAPIIPLRTKPTMEQIERSYGKDVAEAYFNEGENTASIGRNENLSDEQATSIGGLAVSLATTMQAIEESHTGQHYRNRTISVPTAAGEPMRG